MPTATDVLVIPQWQGYAAGDGPARGARAIAAALANADVDALPEVDIPAWHALDREPGGGDVLGLDEIVGHAAAALRWLDSAGSVRLLVIGGDCGSDFAPMIWQAGRCGDELGVLYLDAHADINTPASSPSGRFHGMVLRSVLGDGAAPLIALCRHPVSPAQVVMAGTRDVDEPERVFLDAVGIRPLPPQAFGDGRVLDTIRAHPARCWHVHLDLDVLDPADFPDVTVPTPGGPTLDEVTELLVALVREREVASLAITEHIGGPASAARIGGLVAALRRAGW
jgi:arginase